MSQLTAAEATDLFRRPPDDYIDVGQGEVAYRRVGQGPDVLFVHGWPVSGATFRLLLPHLVDHVTCHLIDLPGTGSSRFDAETTLTIDNHIDSVRRVAGELDVTDLAVVGHDSGGLIARHAMVDHPRLRAMALIDTEPSGGVTLKFKSFILAGRMPGFGRMLGWVVDKPKLRRNGLVLGGAFEDRSKLDGEFDELFLRPLHDDPARLDAAVRLLRSFEFRYIDELAGIHRRITVPVQLVWGELDAFFPLSAARAMASSFPDAELTVIEGAGLFAHEEAPGAVAEALLPTLLGQR